MDRETAEKIVLACSAHHWYQIGLRKDPPPDISNYTLDELINANKKIKEYNEIRNDHCQSLVMDDRLIAALYTLTHYPADCNEAVIINKDKAIVVVALPDDFFEE